MSGGLAFLSKKSFNPSNISNQKAVWEARQQKEHETKAIQERNDELKREREDEELARARGGTRGGEKASLRFMYAPPPGLPSAAAAASTNHTDNNDMTHPSMKKKMETSNEASNITLPHAGDDEAAARFRLFLASATNTSSSSSTAPSSSLSQDHTNHDESTQNENTTTTAEEDETQKSNTIDNRTMLEKAVGRRDTNRALTLDEQTARFPELKNAPMAKGMNGTNVNVNFKPLGAQFRNVRCLKCGIWGHSRGDRECKLSGWDPFGGGKQVVVESGVGDGRNEVTKGSDYGYYGPSSQGGGPSQGGKEREEGSVSSHDSYTSLSSEEEERRRRRRRKRSKKHKRERSKSSRKRDRHSSSSRRRERRKKTSRYDSSSNEDDDNRRRRGRSRSPSRSRSSSRCRRRRHDDDDDDRKHDQYRKRHR